MKQYWIKHRTVEERPLFQQNPFTWNYVGPFSSFDLAFAEWNKIRPNWQEGGIVSRCDHCGQDVMESQ